jgi:DNA-binding transcriptional ArsR family regulator
MWRQKLDGVLLDALWTALEHPGFVPDFLVPRPLKPLATLSEDLQRIARAPVHTVRNDLSILAAEASGHGSVDDCPRDPRDWKQDPVAFRDLVALQLESVWKELVAPLWSAHRGMLEREVLTRGRQLALHGVPHLLRDLHEDVRWAQGQLSIECTEVDLRTDSGRELLLVPSVLIWPKVFVAPPDAGGTGILYYPARGAASMFANGRTPSVDASEALGSLLGSTRARILEQLVRPATTTDLASWLAVSASGVSQHLRRLHEIGLVRRTRVKRRVYYEQTRRGKHLVAMFHEDGQG